MSSSFVPSQSLPGSSGSLTPTNRRRNCPAPARRPIVSSGCMRRGQSLPPHTTAEVDPFTERGCVRGVRVSLPVSGSIDFHTLVNIRPSRDEPDFAGARSSTQKMASRPGWTRLLIVCPSFCRSISIGPRLRPSPRVVRVVLVECLDLAGPRIERQDRGGVEVGARMQVAGPGCGVADTPVDEVQAGS